MLLCLPPDLVAELLQHLSPEDTLRLRAVCRELRAHVDVLARWPEMAMKSAGRGLGDFVRRAHCRPQTVTVRGGVCWHFAAPALAALGEGLRSLRLERAPVGQAQLAMLLRAAPNLDTLRIDNVSGGAVAVPALSPAVRRVHLGGRPGPDPGDLCLGLGGLRHAPLLEELALVLDRPHSEAGPGLGDLEARHTLKKLIVAHWGTTRLADLVEYAQLDTLVLRAGRFVLHTPLVLPGVLRCCVPYRLAEEFVRRCPALYELYIYCAVGDTVSFDLEDIVNVPCLTLHLLPDTEVFFVCDTMLEFDEWLNRSTLRVLCATDVACTITSADTCVSFVMTHTCKSSFEPVRWSDTNWHFPSETL
jgi:hypothetical protein